ncbi:MAG TPA: hypothetical protein DCX65_02615 [Spirochaetaceae bacterium]|nr:hypothetical protein [Spirochaetaceae bacterium]
MAGRQQGRRPAGRVKQGQRRPADQVPAAGAGRRIDAGLVVGNSDRTGRHSGAWRGQPRRGQDRVQATQIGEARPEAQHVHQIVAAGVPGDKFLRRQARPIGGRRQVGAVCAAVVDRQFDHLSRSVTACFRPGAGHFPERRQEGGGSGL